MPEHKDQYVHMLNIVTRHKDNIKIIDLWVFHFALFVFIINLSLCPHPIRSKIMLCTQNGNIDQDHFLSPVLNTLEDIKQLADLKIVNWEPK